MSQNARTEDEEARLNAAMVRLRSRHSAVYRAVQAEADPFGPLEAVLGLGNGLRPGLHDLVMETLVNQAIEAEEKAVAAEVETKRLALALRLLIDASERAKPRCFGCGAYPEADEMHYPDCPVMAARSALRLIDYEDGGWAAVEVLPREDDEVLGWPETPAFTGGVE